MLSRVRAGGALCIGDGAKTVTSPASCVSALRLCALWSILLRITTQCSNSRLWGGSLGSSVGSAFWVRWRKQARGGFWFHQRRGLIYVACAGAGGAVLSGSSGSSQALCT